MVDIVTYVEPIQIVKTSIRSIEFLHSTTAKGHMCIFCPLSIKGNFIYLDAAIY